IVPPVGRSMPAMMCSSDDLPLPDGPTSATLSPARTSNVAAAIATTASGPLPNSRDSPLARTRTSLIGDPAVHQVHDAVGGLRHVAAVGDHQHGLPLVGPAAQQPEHAAFCLLVDLARRPVRHAHRP